MIKTEREEHFKVKAQQITCLQETPSSASSSLTADQLHVFCHSLHGSPLSSPGPVTWQLQPEHPFTHIFTIGAPDQTFPGGVTAYLSFLQEVFVADRYSNKLILKDLNPKDKYCFQAQVTIILQAKSSARGSVTCVTMLG